jgi:hypothetical protein
MVKKSNTCPAKLQAKPGCTKKNCKELEEVKRGLQRVLDCGCERTPIQQEYIDTFVKNTFAYIGHPDEKL